MESQRSLLAAVFTDTPSTNSENKSPHHNADSAERVYTLERPAYPDKLNTEDCVISTLVRARTF